MFLGIRRIWDFIVQEVAWKATPVDSGGGAEE